MSNCNLCPRHCNIDRSTHKGYCGEGDSIRISRADLHFWEEPCISGTNGSGAIFFTGCQLKCVFCQNYDIARNKIGKEISADELCDIFFRLKEKGAHNINLITADHFVPSIVKAIEKAKSLGFDLPFVYNTSAYIKKEQIDMLQGFIDVYLPDLKYHSEFLAKKYSNAKDYPKVAKQAIAQMVNAQNKIVFDNNGLITQGVIVRHLVLPGNTMDSKKVLSYLKETYRDKILISIMSQYTPIKSDFKYPELKRKLYQYEYDEIIDFCDAIGIKNAYIQELESATKDFIPDFNLNI